MKDFEGTIMAFLVIYGEEDIDWIDCRVDAVEWVDTKYFHQN